MTLFVISAKAVTAVAAAPANLSEDELLVSSMAELAASSLSKPQLLEIWNALPDVAPISRFKTREQAVERLWNAFQNLPVREPEPAKAAGPRPGSKQARVIGLLRQPQGATVPEIMRATGWQAHSVRGLFAGALRKKMGLGVVSAVEERGRVYRIADNAGV